MRSTRFKSFQCVSTRLLYVPQNLACNLKSIFTEIFSTLSYYGTPRIPLISTAYIHQYTSQQSSKGHQYEYKEGEVDLKDEGESLVISQCWASPALLKSSHWTKRGWFHGLSLSSLFCLFSSLIFCQTMRVWQRGQLAKCALNPATWTHELLSHTLYN